MDKQEQLSELFRLAKEQEPKTSFEQTKGQFLNSLNNQEKSKDVNSFTFKKWIIMLSSIIGIIGLSVMLINNEQQELPNSNDNFARAVVHVTEGFQPEEQQP